MMVNNLTKSLMSINLRAHNGFIVYNICVRALRYNDATNDGKILVFVVIRTNVITPTKG